MSDDRIVLGVHQLPVWAAKALTNEEDESLLSDEQEDMLNEWTESLSGISTSFEIMDTKEQLVSYALFSGNQELSVKVAHVGMHSNIDKIEHALLMDEGKVIAALMEGARQTLEHPADHYDNGFVSGEAWRAVAENLPLDLTRAKILQWVRFNNPLYQVWAVHILDQI
jgi:hypothetical protein